MAAWADVAIVSAWLMVLGQNFVLIARGVRRAAEPLRWTAGLALAIGLVVAGVTLERASGGRLVAPGVLTVVGVGLALTGAALHVRARAVLGAAWSSNVAPAPTLVERGPYAVVRHPLYAALALIGLGTVVAHPSLPTLAGALGLALGLALKIAREEESLAHALGARWGAYRARVPCLVPRVFGRR